MSATWYGDAPPPPVASFGLAGWLRVAIKAGLLAPVILGGLALVMLIRLLERPLFDLRRPWTPFITVFVCRAVLRIIGLRLQLRGDIDADASAFVANHASWLDIFVLNASKRLYFVSKSEVAQWPGIGLLARAVGTVFIDRTRARAADQAKLFRDRLGAGHKLLFFPEGTSSDGLRVLPFKTTLFAAFFADELRKETCIQPVSVTYQAPEGSDARFYGWWGDMDFGPHLLSVLAAPRQGRALVQYHVPLQVAGFKDRKMLAVALEQAVRGGHSLRSDLADP